MKTCNWTDLNRQLYQYSILGVDPKATILQKKVKYIENNINVNSY